MGIVNYLSTFSPMPAEVCETLDRHSSVNTAWMWNRSYQEVCKKSKLLVKEDMYMKHYNVRKPLFLETDASRLSLGTALLQVSDGLSCGYDKVPGNAMLWPITFASKGLSSAK